MEDYFYERDDDFEPYKGSRTAWKVKLDDPIARRIRLEFFTEVEPDVFVIKKGYDRRKLTMLQIIWQERFGGKKKARVSKTCQWLNYVYKSLDRKDTIGWTDKNKIKMLMSRKIVDKKENILQYNYLDDLIELWEKNGFRDEKMIEKMKKDREIFKKSVSRETPEDQTRLF